MVQHDLPNIGKDHISRDGDPSKYKKQDDVEHQKPGGYGVQHVLVSPGERKCVEERDVHADPFKDRSLENSKSTAG